MFDHFQEPKAGVKIVEKDKMKQSQKNFEDLQGKMSQKKYK